MINEKDRRSSGACFCTERDKNAHGDKEGVRMNELEKCMAGEHYDCHNRVFWR